jgi:uncharacterized membrane protein
MSSPASFAKHPFHPMLVVFPIGLWIFSFISDLIFWFGWGGDIWPALSIRVMAGGIVGSLLAAIPGFIDFLTLSGRPRTISAYHLTINLCLVVLFAFDFGLRAGGFSVAPWPLLVSFIGVIGLAISGWLGGELVYVHGIAVERK